MRSSSAERTAASTIACVHTFAWTSPSGTGPPRSAAQNAAREPASSQSASGAGVPPGVTVPSAATACGTPSPSQCTVPPSQLISQSPFQLVSWPGEHQEPVKACTAPEE